MAKSSLKNIFYPITLIKEESLEELKCSTYQTNHEKNINSSFVLKSSKYKVISSKLEKILKSGDKTSCSSDKTSRSSDKTYSFPFGKGIVSDEQRSDSIDEECQKSGHYSSNFIDQCLLKDTSFIYSSEIEDNEISCDGGKLFLYE